MSNYRIEKLEKSLEGATKVIFDHSMRKVEYEGVVDYNLFPYQIKDREKFYQRDHPKQISPLSFSFKSYWSQFAKKSIEGIWVEDEGTWVYMMPELFHYINYIRIMGNKKGEEGKRQIMQPDLSSLEWVGFSYIYAGDGFSGFVGDEDYTCNRLVERLYLGEELNEYDLPKLKNCYKPNGKLKTFVDPWEYLTRFYLVDNPRGNLGKPLYENRLEDCIITGSRSVGKDLTEGTLVYNKQGAIKIDDVREGDYVYGADGKLTKVLEKLKFTDEEQFEITLTDGRKVSCGKHHKWNVLTSGSDKQKTKSLEEILKTYKGYKRKSGRKSIEGKYDIKYWLPQPSPIEYPEKKLPIDPYFLGVWLGDGHSNKVAITTEDDEIADYCIDYFEKQGLVWYKSTKANTHAYTLHASSKCKKIITNKVKVTKEDGESLEFDCVKDAAEFLNYPVPSIYSNIYNDRGLDYKGNTFKYAGKKVSNKLLKELQDLNLINNKHLPSQYLISSVEQRMEMLRGLLDTDGTVDDRGNISFTQKSERITDGVITLIRSLGIRCRKKKIKTSVWYKGKKIIGHAYAIYIRTGKPVFKLKRKLNKVLSDKVASKRKVVARHRVGIKDIKPIGIKKSYCIKVDNKDKLFVCEDYITTHNSYMIYPGKFMHSWTFGSVRDFSEENKAQLSNRNLFAMGAGAKDPLNRSLKLIKSFYDAQPGKYRYPDPDRPNYMGPYYKNVQGAWEAGAEIQHLLKERNNIDALVGSSLQMNVITPDRKRIAAGDRFLGIYIEEAGFLEYLPEVWGANKDSMEAEGYKVGRAYATGTSGDIKAVDGIKKLMENPRGYQLTPIPNYWKNPDKEIGLFLSALYRFRNYQDDNGNRDLNSAIQFLAKERTKNAEQMDSAAFDDYILYAPMNPDEMLRPNRRSFLPGAKAQERLSDIDAYDLYALNATEGDFKFDPGEEYGVGFKKGSEIPPIRDYQLDRARVKLEGCPIVYEHPDGYIPENLYWVVFDPVSKPGKGESIDASLNSVIVYKWFYTGSSQTLEDNIVAEWVGRHDQLEDTYELVVKMAKYFNAKIFPETNTPGFVDWCTRNNYSQLLQEEAVLAMKEINPKFTGRRGKVGFSIYGDRMKPWLLQRFKSWLLRKRGEDQEGNFESYTIDNILSERLLNEIANFNEKGNFDHISSMLGLMLLITQFDHEPPNLQVIKQRDEPTFEYKLVKRKPRRSLFEQSSYM